MEDIRSGSPREAESRPEVLEIGGASIPAQFARSEDAAVFERYAALIRRLRAPDGCPWDRKQTLSSLRTYLIQEAYELVSAIDEQDARHIAEELGDVFLVALLMSDALENEHQAPLQGVLDENALKLVRRHPHVFGDTVAKDADEVVRNWNEIKRQERESDKNEKKPPRIDGAGKGAPPIERAISLQNAAAKQGFDWSSAEPAIAKLEEETQELIAALSDGDLDHGSNREHATKELGDILFSAINVARKLDIDPNLALNTVNNSFVRRFSHVQERIATSTVSASRSAPPADVATMEVYWQEAKELGL